MLLTERVQTIVMGFGQLMSSLIALVLVAILARTISSDELGIYLYYMAFAGAVEGLSDIGLRLRGVSALSAASSSQQHTEIMGALWRLKFTLSLAVVGLVVMISAIGGLQYADSYTAVLIALVAVTLPSSSPFVWELRAAGLQWSEAIALVLYRLFMLGAVLIATKAALDAESLLMLMLFSNMVFMLLLLVAREAIAGLPAPSLAIQALGMDIRLLASAVPLGMSLLVAQFAPRVWILVLAAIDTPKRVAEFSVSVAVIQTTLLVSVAAGAAYLPLLSRKAISSPDEFWLLTGRLLDSMATFGSAISLVLALGAAGVVPSVFGESMPNAGVLVVVLAVLPPVLLVSFNARLALGVLGAGTHDLLVAVTGLCCGAIVAFGLEAQTGFWAVVAGYAVSEYATCLGRLLLLRKRVPTEHIPLRGTIGKVLVALIVAIPVGLALHWIDASLTLSIGAAIAGLTLYAAGLLAFPSVRRRDLWQLLP